MTLEPVSAVARAAVARAVAGAHARSPPDPALTLRLVLGANSGGEPQARDAQGHVYRLGGIGPLPRWAEGQTLLVQVLRAGPPLEVRLLGTLTDDANAGADADIELPALRPDQAAILRLAAAASDTMAQAALWRQRTLATLRQASTVAPGHATLATPAAAEAPSSPGDAALLLRVLPWHGWPLTLWVEQRRWSGGPNRRARHRTGTRLCLALTLPRWGPVALVLDVLDVQVGLTVIATQAHAVAPLRAQVGAMAARLARAGLRLMRCHVRHVPDHAPPVQAGQPNGLADHELPLALFRAGAEALEALRRAA